MSIIFHIDVNSAYLSWEAVHRLNNGETLDIREIPSVIGGDPVQRKGIVLAKSMDAKKCGVVTGESLYSAFRKCPNLVSIPPNHRLYAHYSELLFQFLSNYSPVIQRFSIDECFLDYTGCENILGPPLEVAYKMKDKIKEELGFTVNIGISSNKLLAKMASDFEKPDKIHTLFPDEIKEKLWPLPVSELFMVGKATSKKLSKMNINTIGELAKTKAEDLILVFKSQGMLLWNYANGIDHSKVEPFYQAENRSIGNSITTQTDILQRQEALKVLLGLSEKVAGRLRKESSKAKVIVATIKTNDFKQFSHQITLKNAANSTGEIYQTAVHLFDEMWKGQPIRLLGISVSDLEYEKEADYQLTMFEEATREKNEKLDQAMDAIRKKFGGEAIVRGRFMKK